MVFQALLLSIGLPFLLLGSTSPLLQTWLARLEHGRIPYRLFALSNLASLLALALYPTIVEPHLTLRTQRIAWGCGFACFAVLFAILGWGAGKAPVEIPIEILIENEEKRVENEPPAS